MEHISAEVGYSKNTRRWPRYPADLPVRIVALNGIQTIPLLARGSVISTAGMALRAAINVKTGDVMQLQFPTSRRVMAVVRNRNSYCLGLEFLPQLLPAADNKALDRSTHVPSSVLRDQPELRESARKSCSPKALYAGLHRKREEFRKLQAEIEALKLAMSLLADGHNDDQNDHQHVLSRPSMCDSPASVSAPKPWPKPKHFEDADRSTATPRVIS